MFSFLNCHLITKLVSLIAIEQTAWRVCACSPQSSVQRFRSADFTGNDVWLQSSKSVHPLPIGGLQQETNAYSYLVLGPWRDGLFVLSFFFLLTQRCFLARPLTPLARGCSCFWREPRGEGTRQSSSSSCVLKCQPAIVSVFCILTCVLRCPGAQVPGYSDLVLFCPPYWLILLFRIWFNGKSAWLRWKIYIKTKSGYLRWKRKGVLHHGFSFLSMRSYSCSHFYLAAHITFSNHLFVESVSFLDCYLKLAWNSVI